MSLFQILYFSSSWYTCIDLFTNVSFAVILILFHQLIIMVWL